MTSNSNLKYPQNSTIQYSTIHKVIIITSNMLSLESFTDGTNPKITYNQKPRPCGCKGCRTCLVCENEYGALYKSVELPRNKGYVYCPYCNKAYEGWDMNSYKTHPNHEGVPIDYKGVYIHENFLSDPEEQDLLKHIDNVPWSASQSGRRKQNYGPKCNFKKRKLNVGGFEGFPQFSKSVQDKFRDVPILKGFQTIEQCSLEYSPKTGASIDPHIDDCWIWGERIVTLNLLSDTILTMTRNDELRYNLECVKDYAAVLDESGGLNTNGECYKVSVTEMCDEFPIVRIPMPKKSLLVLYGPARYDWKHQVLREDIYDRRICIAYREFTPPYLPEGVYFEKGRAVLEKAQNFF